MIVIGCTGGSAMSMLDQLLRSLLASTVNSLVKQALAEQSRSGPDGHDPELFHVMIYPDASRVHVDPTAVLNNALLNVSSGDITIGPYTFCGHNVSLLTGTHDYSKFGAERQVAVPKVGRDIVIGAHAVVGVGSLVLKDVDPYTVVAGSPATVRATIPQPGGES